MIEGFPYIENDPSDVRTDLVLEKRERFLVQILENFFDYVAVLVKRPKASLDFSEVTLELKQEFLDKFLLEQHPGFSDEERMELRETLLHMF
jgi:hypothetical protein